MKKPPESSKLIASGFERGCGSRASWRAYRLEDGSAWISVNGECVDEGEALSEEEAVSRARALAAGALRWAP